MSSVSKKKKGVGVVVFTELYMFMYNKIVYLVYGLHIIIIIIKILGRVGFFFSVQNKHQIVCNYLE